MFDILIKGGRVIDPETSFDAVTDIAVSDGIVAAIGADLGQARSVIEASGLVVTAGFIDLHAHGQSVPADRMQAFDGVTTSLELEFGVLPIGEWYEEQAAHGRVLNYGASVGWLFGRIATMTSQRPASTLEGMGLSMQDKRWSTETATPAQISEIVNKVRTGFLEGGLGIGFPNGYAPGAGVKELSELCSLAASYDAPTFTHIANVSNIDPLSSIEGYTRLIGLAGSTGAHMHICHFNSASLLDIERAAELVRTAQKQGLKVTVEAYPYGTGSTVVGASHLRDPNFPDRFGADYSAIELVANRHRFRDRDDLLRSQKENSGALVLIHFLDIAINDRHRELLDTSVMFPGGAIASDAMPWILADGSVYTGDAWPLPADAVSHPRSSGTFTKFVSEWIRDRQVTSLVDGLRKCSLIPAQILEKGIPAMRRKGRLSTGCDADIVMFDLNALEARADFDSMNRPSEGVRHLLVCGTPVIRDARLLTDARPGRAVRRPTL